MRERERGEWVTCEKIELGDIGLDWSVEKKKEKACNGWINDVYFFIGDAEWCNDHPEADGDGYI